MNAQTLSRYFFFFLVAAATPGVAAIKLNSALAPGDEVRSFAVTTDGTRAVYQVFHADGSESLHSVAADGSDHRTLVSQDLQLRAFGYEINQPGTHVALLARPVGQLSSARDLYSLPISGGPPLILHPPAVGPSRISNFKISPDGQHVVFRGQLENSYAELYSVVIGGGDPVKLSGPLVRFDHLGIQQFEIDPTSQRVVYQGRQDNPDQPHLHSVAITEGPDVKLNNSLPSNYRANFFMITPDGSTVYFTTRGSNGDPHQLFRSPIEGGGATLLDSGGSMFLLGITPDSNRLMFSRGLTVTETDANPFSIDRDSTTPVQLGDEIMQGVLDSSLTPDGVRFLYEARLDLDGGIRQQLVYSVLSGGGGKVLTHAPFDPTDSSAAAILWQQFSPDSQYFVQRERTNGVFRLFHTPVIGGGPRTELPEDSFAHQYADNSTIVASQDGDLISIATSTGEVTELSMAQSAGAPLSTNWVLNRTAKKVFYRAQHETLGLNEVFVASLPARRLSIADTIGFEPNEAVELTVTLSEPSQSETVSVFYSTQDDTALAGSDYDPQSASLTFNPGEQSKIITIPIVNDTLAEGEETFFVTLSAPSGASLDRSTAQVTIRDELPTPRPVVAASVLPASRSVQVGSVAAAFASVVNISGELLLNCGIAPITAIPATFSYQTTDPQTNVLTGVADVPVAIPPDGVQTYVFSFMPTEAFDPTLVQLDFSCVDASFAKSVPGLNRFQLSASTVPTPDIVALTTTVDLPVTINETALFAVASANVGDIGQVTVSADTGETGLPIDLFVCQTDPLLGTCSSDTARAITIQFDPGATPTFAVFVTATASIANNPESNRIFVRFRDAEGRELGSSSTAVRTEE